jgi:hypothetical protein
VTRRSSDPAVWSTSSAAPRPATCLPPRLLGPFDPLLHGWRDRSAILGAHQGVVTVNGLFRPILLAGGRALGTWGLAGHVLRVAPFEPLSDTVGAAVGSEAAAVGGYLGLGPLTVETAPAAAAGDRARRPVS